MSNYTIPQGWHYSLKSFSDLLGLFTWKRDSVFLNVKFSSTCLFTKRDNDDKDINKLYGFSYGFHHKNSVRLGWVPDFGSKQIKIYYYHYNNGKLSYGEITRVPVNEFFPCNIQVFDDRVRYQVKSEIVEKKFARPSFPLGYWLRPYFGGNNTAPHEMRIFVDDVK
jgi:hypothetical protein